MIVEMDHPKIGRMKSLGLPVKSSGELLAIRHAAPWLGQHTDEILREFGYAERDLAAMHAEGALYDKYRDEPPAQRAPADKVTAQ
jgi:crotonobetainyl-CoA:carnitine CoA-transferase CaiB-like acyl-CoA transferase